MAGLCTIAQGMADMVVANKPLTYVATVTNTSALPVSLTSLSCSEGRHGGTSVQFDGPDYLIPNVPVGFGNPVIPAGGSASFTFRVVFYSPYSPGDAAQAAAAFGAPFAPDANYLLQVQGNFSDGSVFQGTLQVPVLTALAATIAQGGGFQFSYGGNLVNGLTSFVI